MLKVEVFGQNLQNIVEIFFHIVMFFSVGSVLLVYRIEKLYIFLVDFGIMCTSILIFSLSDSFHNDFTIRLPDDKFVKILLIILSCISFKTSLHYL